MKMAKICTTVCLTVATVVGVTIPSGMAASNASAPVTIHMLYTGAEAGEAGILRAAKLFEQQNPGITVQIDGMSYNDLQAKVYSELSQQSDYYDLMAIDPAWMPQLVRYIEPLSSYIQNSKHPNYIKLNDFIPKVFLDTCVFNPNDPSQQPPAMNTVDLNKIAKAGFEVYGLPTTANALTVTYRKDLFDNPTYRAEFKKEYGHPLTIPQTLDQYLQIAQFFTRNTPNGKLYGTTLMAAKAEAGFVDFKSFLSDFGGSIFDKNMKPAFNSPIGVKTLEYYGSWINKYKVTPPGVTNYTWDEVTTAFGAGLTAMAMNYNDMQLDPNVKGDLGYFLFPGVKNANGQIVRGPQFGGFQVSVTKFSQHKQDAYDFLEWITSPQMQKSYLKYNQHLTRFSAYQAAAAMPNYPKKAFFKVLGQSLNYGVGRPRIVDYNEVSAAVQVAMSNYLAGRQGAKQALDAAAQQVEQIMQRDGYYNKK